MTLQKFFLLSIPGVIAGYLLSWKLHPFLYRSETSQFAKLRGGPGIGYAAIFTNGLIKMELLNDIIDDENRILRNALGTTWGFAEIAGGVFIADMCRSVERYKEDGS